MQKNPVLVKQLESLAEEVVVVAVVATALPHTSCNNQTVKEQLQIDSNAPKQKSAKSRIRSQRSSCSSNNALPTPAVTTKEFKPKEVFKKLKTCFDKGTSLNQNEVASAIRSPQ